MCQDNSNDNKNRKVKKKAVSKNFLAKNGGLNRYILPLLLKGTFSIDKHKKIEEVCEVLTVVIINQE